MPYRLGKYRLIATICYAGFGLTKESIKMHVLYAYAFYVSMYALNSAFCLLALLLDLLVYRHANPQDSMHLSSGMQKAERKAPASPHLPIPNNI